MVSPDVFTPFEPERALEKFGSNLFLVQGEMSGGTTCSKDHFSYTTNLVWFYVIARGQSEGDVLFFFFFFFFCLVNPFN